MSSRKGINEMNEVKKKVSNPLFQSTALIVEEKEEELIRKTYFLDTQTIESIRLLSFYNKEKISPLVRKLLRQAIPDNIWEEAGQNIQ